MSFEQEWGLHRQSAVEGPARMRLNQLPGDQGGAPTSGGGPGVLATAPPEKKKAANTIENVLQPGTTKAADAADEPTKTAVKAFTGWDTGAGLSKAHTHWGDQVKRLMGRLNSEKTALRGASNLFTGNDQLTGGSFQPVQSKIAGL
ncbi:hypothetical protein GCM10010371_59290 [Streptomyces subrutilus]|uniref:Uncharacterized protein n=2 Tax=Streptomyces subrutilus TaxID=36818 RepID=A0A918VDS1_9ACTN|nr:hypothetical protein GCM10010371_59290 [Streptomyces subrutilus]